MFYLFPKIFKSLSQNERRVIISASVFFLISLFFIASSAYYQKTEEQPAFGGSYTEGVLGQPTFVNPLIANTSSADKDLIDIIFSSLDDLVENYQISEDNKTWTLTLKNNLVWSDSEPITADDIIYTIETIQNYTNNHPLYPTWRGIVIERLNENEIRFTLKTPYVFLIDNFKELKIAPQHIYGAIPASNFRLSRYNLEAIGSGPYKFESLQTRKDGFITDYQLTINEYYHDQPPYIKNLNFKFYNDETELIQAFNKRNIDGLGGLSQNIINQIKVGHQTITANLPRYYAIFFNPNTNEQLKNKNLRTALSLAVDKKGLIEKIFNNQAITIESPLPPNINGYNPEINQSASYNLKQAAKLLDNSGFTINNENVRLKLNIIVPDIPFLIETVNLIKNDWSKINVELNPIVLNLTDISNDVIRTRNYELLIFGNILKQNPDLFSFWHSSERFYPGRNLSLYNNPKVDNLLESIRQDFNNHSRNQKLNELQKLIKDEAPAIFLYSPNYLYVSHQDLKGYRSYFIATPADRFDQINQWHLKTTRVFK